VRADLYIESVLAKCEALKDSGLWAPEPRLRPAAWLDNFTDDQERLLAAVLLDNFVFYSDRASDRLLVAAYNRLEDDVLLGRVAQQRGDPQTFLDSLLFTPVEGEHPRPTDSGKTLCRKLRDLIELDDERFFDPTQALAEVRAGGRPLVFVDDFLGTGQQLIKTWERPYPGGGPPSFKDSHATRPFPVFCLALLATDTAIRNVRAAAPEIAIVSTHVLDDSYSARLLAAPPLVPPINDFQAALRAFLQRHAASFELKDFLLPGDWPLFGFHELALLFAFEHGVPDSTLPLLWAKGVGGWIRLVKYQ
jgi:hypothetical protein